MWAACILLGIQQMQALCFCEERTIAGVTESGARATRRLTGNTPRANEESLRRIVGANVAVSTLLCSACAVSIWTLSMTQVLRPHTGHPSDTHFAA
jgi:hypothetical protein